MDTKTTEPQKVSSAAIMSRLDNLAANTNPLLQNARQFVVYKPNPRAIDKGVAAKFNFYVALNTDPEKQSTPEFPLLDGGFFVDLVPQIPSDNAFAKFDWKNNVKQSNVTTKLGLPDLSAFLLGYREVRLRGGDVPTSIRPITKVDGKWVPSTETNMIGLVHKFKDKITVLKWTFDPARGSLFEISKGAEGRRSISFTLAEEVLVMKYFELGMEALLIAGL